MRSDPWSALLRPHPHYTKLFQRLGLRPEDIDDPKT